LQILDRDLLRWPSSSGIVDRKRRPWARERIGLRRGAIASSVAHDSHNLVVIGANDDDMRAAIAAIAQMEGGQVAVVDGQVCAACPLPIAGLISDRPLEEVCAQGRPSPRRRMRSDAPCPTR